MEVATNNLEQALERFGLKSFRPGQREVIESIVSGADSLCVMPTGGGKSLCFQLPSIIRPGLTIVVSPLIALMKDQVDRLGQLGIPAALINSTLSASEQQTRLQDVASGKYQLVYVAPERLRNNRFMEAIRATPVQLLAIDEAHCISQWGHDFRPDYTRIGRFREWLGGVQTVALTATATPRVREDICQVLGLKRPRQFMSGFARPNLHFGIVNCQNERDKDEQLESFLARTDGAGIVYCATRKRCDALVEMISKKLRISAGAYHAGLMLDQRRAIQERFMQNDLRVIVATNAFGMGIDKADLRFVIHYNMPGSLEAYYQEAGRAGRDGLHSQCVMLYSYQDRFIQEFFIDNNYPPREVIQQVYEFLQQRDEDPIELTLEEIRDALGLSISPEAIGSSLQIISRTRVLERLEMGAGLAQIRIDSTLPTLVDLLPKEAKVQRKVLTVLEKAVGDRRGEPVQVHPRWLLQNSELGRDALGRALRELSKLESVDYVPPFRGRAVHFKKRDIPFNELEIDFANLQSRKDAEYDRLNQVVNYAQSPLCRQLTILRYFGDESAENCGQCDRCLRSPGWPKFEQTSPGKPKGNGSGAPEGNEQSDAHRRSHNPKATTENADSPEAAKQLTVLESVVQCIEQLHGRLGKHLIAQYLCGSKNAKVQKLNLHRLSGFGFLQRFRQADAVSLLDSLLAAGILQQQEVNRNRPTIAIAGELVADNQQLRDLLGSIVLDAKVAAKAQRVETTLGRQTAAVTGPKPAGQPEARPSGSPADASDVSTAAAIDNRSHTDPAMAETGKGAVDADALTSSAKGPKPEAVDPEAILAAAQAQDWKWTVKLFKDGFRWLQIQAIRRMTDAEVADSLSAALKAGHQVERTWLSGETDAQRSAGQQRLLRELQRRSAAGIQ